MGSSNTTPSTRKRARAQNDEEPSSSTAKKPKTRPSSTVSWPTVVEDEDEDGADQESNSRKTTNGPLRRGRGLRTAKAPKGSPPEETSSNQPQQAAQHTTDSTRLKKLRASASSQKSSIYDVPDSGEDELNAAAEAPPKPKRGKPTAPVKTAAEIAPALTRNEEAPPKRKRGRPSKKDLEARAKAQNSLGSSSNQNQGLNGDAATTGTSAQKIRRLTTTAKGRKGEDSELPKGILTPRKGKAATDRQPKSVAFGSRLDEDALEELAVGTPSKSARKRIEVAGLENNEHASDEGSGSDEEDDEVCAICSKPDSEPPNEIVFCDNCDMPVHQECYGLAEVPEGDWICRNCSQDDATSANRSSTDAQLSVVAREDQRPEIPNFDLHLRLAQRVLLDRCSGRRRIKLRGQDEAYDKAYQLVEQTVVAGEGNSMMVIGARGCGKTTLVESVLADLSKNHEGQFHVVRLNGFIHTDDKLALREIWRQLGKEMAVEDELVNKTTNHADTMASLLALLSHPSEIAEGQDGITSKSIIFVIDEFDLFATHARQTLLYNLFDIAQARKAPIAVLGLTTRIDVVESLEKRVKSRFSHRYVYLSLPKSLPAYWDVCKQGLSIDVEDMILEGIDPSQEGHRAFWDWWNSKIESLHKTQSFTDHLESHFYSTKSVSAFLTTAFLDIDIVANTFNVRVQHSKLHLLGSLSDLDLSLLIAAARLDIVAHTDTVNFAMAYDEYTSLMGRQRVQSVSSGMLALGGGARVWGRGTAGIAWERLVAVGLLVPAAAGGRGTAGLGGLDAKMWKLDVALEEIPAAVKLNAVLARWCKEI
ncbi:hypothetical protein NEMBOFW57_007395 [Staphylotrichum longicolle]|uniref:Origin recognition complex subunit 4 n=1 Tax=Staphylotrichum longicolle TaxID=669026 RepID=A0AAD4EUK2_9PEZI|nr:hypothetical protein NEMBOFW57_007395 [Staphylotrichum longicolle]